MKTIALTLTLIATPWIWTEDGSVHVEPDGIAYVAVDIWVEPSADLGDISAGNPLSYNWGLNTNQGGSDADLVFFWLEPGLDPVTYAGPLAELDCVFSGFGQTGIFDGETPGLIHEAITRTCTGISGDINGDGVKNVQDTLEVLVFWDLFHPCATDDVCDVDDLLSTL